MIDAMANEQNLRPSEYKLSQEEAKKGGINSGKARRRKKEFRELFEKMLAETGGNLNGKPVTRKELIVARAMKILQDPDSSDAREFLKAFEIVRDTIGEKPVEKVMVAEVSQDVIDEVERMVLENDEQQSGTPYVII